MIPGCGPYCLLICFPKSLGGGVAGFCSFHLLFSYNMCRVQWNIGRIKRSDHTPIGIDHFHLSTFFSTTAHIFPRGKVENICGWYHSHPGYGCWLSGIDVQTQMTYLDHVLLECWWGLSFTMTWDFYRKTCSIEMLVSKPLKHDLQISVL